ncbi:MAG TPA: EamA family transporter, partial [Vicinamibacteria bacterium]|nr:EamA family transporter [Vicinamibacteria bacterium]
MSPRRRGLLPWLCLAIVWVVWGSTYLAIAVAVREVPPMAAAALRFVAAGLVMGAIALVADRGQPRPTLRQLADYALAGVLLLSVGNALVMWAEKRIPSGIAALIVATVPLWLLVLDGLRRGGRAWTARAWAGTVIGLVGVALVARPEGGVQAGHWAAIAALQVACISWAIGSLYAQNVPRRLPLFTAAAIEMLAGGGVLVLESVVMREDLSLFASASAAAWWAIGYLGLFGSLVAFTAFAFALNELPASTVGTYAYVNPVVAVALGSVFLHEPLSPGLLAGAALIVAAVVLTTLRPRAQRR